MIRSATKEAKSTGKKNLLIFSRSKSPISAMLLYNRFLVCPVNFITLIREKYQEYYANFESIRGKNNEHKNNGQESKASQSHTGRISHFSLFAVTLRPDCLHTIAATAALYPEIVDPHPLLESSHRFDFHCCRKHTVTHSIIGQSVISWLLLTRASDWSNLCMEHCRINLLPFATVGMLSSKY